MTGTTVIKNADWVVGWDATTGGHKYIRNGDVVFSGEGITFVGKNYSADADTTIDGRGLMILPGTLSLHAHAYVEIHGKGFWEDLASKHLWMSQLYEYSTLFQLVDDETTRPATQAGICELLRSGCTTFAELSCPPPAAVPRLDRHPGGERDPRLSVPHGPVRRVVHDRWNGRPVPLVRGGRGRAQFPGVARDYRRGQRPQQRPA